MYSQELPTDLRIITVSSTGTMTNAKKLVNDAFGAKAAAAQEPPNKDQIAVEITPSAALTVTDALTGDAFVIAINTTKRIDCIDPLDHLNFTDIATVNIVIFYSK